jgi:hypothetical protein
VLQYITVYRYKTVPYHEVNSQPDLADPMTALPLLLLSLASLLSAETLAAPLADAVASLPGYGAPPAPQYSGFLDATAADPEAGVRLHYWYAQSTSADPEAPVTLWLNGMF